MERQLRKLYSVMFVAFTVFSYGQTEAKIRQNSSYNYFRIQGHSAVEIYKSLLKHAKGPAGHDAYATTTIQVFQKSRFSSGASCKLDQIELQAIFKISLPKLNSSPSTPSVARSWQNFAGTLRNHEEHHRSLWMGCVGKLEAQVRNLQASSCDSLKVKLKQSWKKIERLCMAENNAFDKAEQINLLKQPFIKMVVRGN
jgi:predicted secreted Zn-dependent protease